MPIRPS